MYQLVSIIVTSYNHVEFLPQRMESLLAQSYPNIEIIVVDDGSTDGSREFLKQFGTKPNIRLFLQDQNSGYVPTTNFGVSQAKGDYILIAECDDFAEPEQVSSLMQRFSADEKIGVVFSRSYLIDQHGTRFGVDYTWTNATFKRAVQYDRIIEGNLMQKFFLYSCVIPNMSAAIIKKALFERVLGFSDRFRLAADLDFWIRISAITDFYYLTEPLNNFREHSSSIRSKVGKAGQLIETISIVSPVSKRLDLSLKERMGLKCKLGNIWLLSARTNFSQFTRTFFRVWLKCLKQEPFLLLFLLLNIPFVAASKAGKFLRLKG